jgi:Mn2+/Fe2+ NRAMP family transporter
MKSLSKQWHGAASGNDLMRDIRHQRPSKLIIVCVMLSLIAIHASTVMTSV